MRQSLIIYGLLFLLATMVNAQTTRVAEIRNFETGDLPFYNKATGEELTKAEFSSLLERNNNRISMYPRVDKFGKIYAYDVDTANTSGRTIPPAEPVLSAGDSLMPFVMTGMDGQTYDSYSLRGTNLLIAFYISFSPPFYEMKFFRKTVEEFNERSEALNLKMLSLVHRTTAEIAEEYEGLPDGVVIIPDARNFSQRYGIARYPAYMVVDRHGMVKGYLHDPFDTEQLENLLGSGEEE